jgi:PAS domain S-box-containing protein
MADPSFPDTPYHAPSALEAAHAAQEAAEDIADALKVTERRYRRLFETARDGILLLDPATGQITDANPFMAELLGYSHAQFLGKELWEIGLLRNKAASQEAFHHLQKDHYIRFENLPLETRSGERREVEFVSNLYRENGHTVIQCNIRDITDRKMIEHVLADSEEHFRTLYETMAQGVIYQDGAGTLISANPAAQRILGLTIDEMAGRISADPRWKAVHEDGTPCISDQHPPMQALKTGHRVLGVVMGIFNPRLNETRWLRVDSVPQFRPGENRPYQVYSTFEDITEARQVAVEKDWAEEKAREYATKLEAVIEQTPAGIYIGTESGITTCNALGLAMLGFDSMDDLRQNIAVLGERMQTRWVDTGERISPDQLPFTRALGGECVSQEVEYCNVRTGHTTIVQCDAVPILENGRVIAAVALNTDITERKDAERQLAAAAVKNERIAEILQRSMLESPPTGKFPGIVVETLYAAAMNESDVGGDFFDAFALSEEKVALVMGDVSGKGLVAASRIAEVKYALRAFLHAHQAPELALTFLNEFIYVTHHLDPDNLEAFIVLSLAVLNTATGEATFSSAGAEPTLILRADGTAEAVEITGMPLGVRSNSAYTARTSRLESGETVLMATDGITEARMGHEFLGSEGLTALVVQAGPNTPLGALLQVAYDGACAFAGGTLHDDACLLLARRQ